MESDAGSPAPASLVTENTTAPERAGTTILGQFGENDPSVQARLDRSEVYPMRIGVARAQRA